jgi:hypothetical protein
MHQDKTLECLNFICQDGLSTKAVPDGKRRVIIPGINDTFCGEGVGKDVSWEGPFSMK